MKNSKLNRKFVMRTDYNNKDVHTSQRKFKTLGWHTGESPEVLSVHRTESVRSDHPALFKFNPIDMRTEKDELKSYADCEALEPITVNEIIEAILSADATILRQYLQDMCLCTLSSESDLAQDYRQMIAYTYQTIDKTLRGIEHLNIQNAIVAKNLKERAA